MTLPAAPGNCTCRTAAAATCKPASTLFECIDLHVEIVFTYAGARTDTIYSRDSGKWSAIPVEDRPIDGITPVSAKSKT